VSPTPAAQDRQDTWFPVWLVDVPSAAAPKNFSSKDGVASGGVVYAGRVIDVPEVVRDMTDVFWGWLEESTVTVRLANHDAALNHLYTTDLRGTPLVLKRLDLVSATLATEFTGKIVAAALDDGFVTVTAKAPELGLLEELVPKGVVTTGLFHASAPDVGATIPVRIGNVVRAACPYVRDDTAGNLYDYLVSRGAVAVSAVYRDGPNGTLHLVSASEYTVSTSTYTGFTTIRFTTRQINHQNGFHRIHADVTGLSAERNPAKFVRTLLTDAAWGLSQTADATTFDQAEADIIAVGGLVVDADLFEPRRAGDVLRLLMMIRGMRLGYTSDAAWTLTVDTEAATTKMDIGDGTGPGERNLLRIVSGRRRPSLDEQVKGYTLRYRLDPLDAESRVEISRVVSTVGRDVVLEHPYLRDDTAADKTLYYLSKRAELGSELCEVEVTQEGRKLLEADVVRVTSTTLALANTTMEVRRPAKGLDSIRLLLGSWSADWYGYAAGTAPTDPALPVLGAPSAPSGVTGTSLIEAVRISWTVPTEKNFDVVEIWRSATNDRATATKVGESRGVSFLDSNLTALTRYYYWTRSRDTLGRVSAFTQGDLAGLAVDTAGRIGYKLTLNVNSRIFTGTFPASVGVAAMSFDASDVETDWLVRSGTDIHAGEATQNASVATALGAKFLSQAGDVFSAWDGTHVQIALVVGGVVKYAKLDKDGVILTSPTTLFSPSAGDSYARAAIAVRGTTVYWALLYNVGTPFTSSKLRYARTDLSGAVLLAPTDVAGATMTPAPADDIRIGVDSDLSSHVFYKGQNIQAFQANAFQNDAFQCDAPVVMKYVKLNTAGAVLIGPSTPMEAPTGTTDLAPAGVLVDANDAVHVIGYTYTGVGLMCSYGRMTKAAVVEVPMSLFYATPTDVRFAIAAMDTTLNQIYVGWASTTAIHQLRLDPVDPTGLSLEFALPGVSL